MSYLQKIDIIKCSPEPLAVELEVCGDGVTCLESVEFHDGAIATTPIDYARLVAGLYGDPDYSTHKHWCEIEAEAQRIHADLLGEGVKRHVRRMPASNGAFENWSTDRPTCAGADRGRRLAEFAARERGQIL